MKIFLSYPTEERPTAERIQFALRANGHVVFFDRSDLLPGREYDQAIREAIGHCDLLVFLISPAAIAAGRYTLTELGLAEKRWSHPHGRVLPVMVRDTPIAELPAYLQAVSILTPRGNAVAETAHEVERLVRSLRTFPTLARRLVSPAALIATALLALTLVVALRTWRRGRQQVDPPFLSLSNLVRARTRVVAAADSTLLAVTADPSELVPFSERGLEIGHWGPIRGSAIVTTRTPAQLFVATQAPDAITVFNAIGGAAVDSIQFDARHARRPATIPAAKRLSSDIRSIAVADGTLWIVTGERDGDPGVYRFRSSDRVWALPAWPTMPSGFDFDARGLELRTVGRELWAVTAQTTPASIYRIVGESRVDEFRGHDIAMVSCATDLAEHAGGNLLVLSCDNELQELHPDGDRLVLVRSSPTAPPEHGPGRWTSHLLLSTGRSVLVALNTEVGQPTNRPSHLRIVEVDSSGASTQLLDLPDAVATSIAANTTTVAVTLRRADGLRDAIMVRRAHARGAVE